MERRTSVSPSVITESKVPAEQSDRYGDIKKQFENAFEVCPDYFARAPGRVNLIGEHIDYCGYAVLPMALEQDIIMAVAWNKTSTRVKLYNSDSDYGKIEFGTLSEALDSITAPPRWYHYLLCGVKGVVESRGGGQISDGLCVLVSGSLPSSKGLSSSSAMVCAAALFTAYHLQMEMTRIEIADVCAKSERYIGTQGGGMDQAIAFLAQKGTAKLIEFNPLQATDVKLPEGAVFVIADSMTSMNKAATAEFNIRVVETRLAAKLLCKLTCPDTSWRDLGRLEEVQTKLGKTSEEMLEVVLDNLHTHPYDKEEIAASLGVTSSDITTQILTDNTKHVESFKLYERAVHVFSEANRVAQFKILCTERPSNVLQDLGDLMNESHASCRDLYECSCSELDELTSTCRSAGALGSRLTGAGWGGCVVSLVPSSKVTDFIMKVRDGFYQQDTPRWSGITKSTLFATQPGSGAAVYTL